MIRFFTGEDIRKKVSMSEAIGLMKEAFVQLSSNSVEVPVRTMIHNNDDSGRTLYMPSYSSTYQLFGLKMVSVFADNTDKGLPVIQGNMMVMDGKNGSPLAVLEAAYLTALRTGAASGLATDLLSRKDAEVLAIFGAGTQAETQLEGVLNVRSVKKVIVFGRTSDQTIRFCDRMSEKFGIPITPTTSPAELKLADIICTATSSSSTVFQSHHLKAGVHINAIGAYTPTMQEVPSEVIKKSLLIVDQYEAALAEAGDILIPLQEGLIESTHIHAELGEIISGQKNGRTSEGQITVFKSVGNAIQDLAVANYLLRLSQS